MNLDAVKLQVIERIDTLQDKLWQLSRSLYENPEIAFEEHKSAALLTNILEEEGFEVKRAIGGLETAFQAFTNISGDRPTIAFLAEYDALPVLGHACGHNLIAASALGAAFGAQAALQELPGSIRVIGTPAEEGGGGKRILAEAGVFEGLDAAMMIHPASENLVMRGSLASMRLGVEFFGKPAHAAAFPQGGINALDAMLMLFNAINALRQRFEIKDRVAGIIIKGGEAPNVIPAYTSAEFSIRGVNEKRRDEVLALVLDCAEAAAKALGCEVKFNIQPGYSEIVPNKIIATLFVENLKSLGRVATGPSPNQKMGSTDMGNVSKLVPAIHPYLATVPKEVGGHTVEFREICISPKGKDSMLVGAKAMAMTAVDLLGSPKMVSQARKELDQYLDGVTEQ